MFWETETYKVTVSSFLTRGKFPTLTCNNPFNFQIIYNILQFNKPTGPKLVRFIMYVYMFFFKYNIYSTVKIGPNVFQTISPYMNLLNFYMEKGISMN